MKSKFYSGNRLSSIVGTMAPVGVPCVTRTFFSSVPFSFLTEIVPILSAPEEFKLAVIVTVPLPLPEAGSIEIQSTSALTFQLQLAVIFSSCTVSAPGILNGCGLNTYIIICHYDGFVTTAIITTSPHAAKAVIITIYKYLLHIITIFRMKSLHQQSD